MSYIFLFHCPGPALLSKYHTRAEAVYDLPVHFGKVADVPQAPLDILDVFRRPEDLAQHLDDILAAKPKASHLSCGLAL